MRRIIQNLVVYKQYRRIRSRKFDMCWSDKYLYTLCFLLSTVYTLALCSLKVGPGCHCDNADFATGSVCPSDRLATGSVCPSDRLPNWSARCSTVIRRIIHNHGVYKQYRRIRSRKFDMCWSDKYLYTLCFLLSTVYTLALCSLKVGPGCHCANADFATGSVCPSDRPLPEASVQVTGFQIDPLGAAL